MLRCLLLGCWVSAEEGEGGRSLYWTGLFMYYSCTKLFTLTLRSSLASSSPGHAFLLAPAYSLLQAQTLPHGTHTMHARNAADGRPHPAVPLCVFVNDPAERDGAVVQEAREQQGEEERDGRVHQGGREGVREGGAVGAEGDVD